MAIISVRLDDAVKTRLDRLAKAMSRGQRVNMADAVKKAVTLGMDEIERTDGASSLPDPTAVLDAVREHRVTDMATWNAYFGYIADAMAAGHGRATTRAVVKSIAKVSLDLFRRSHNASTTMTAHEASFVCECLPATAKEGDDLKEWITRFVKNTDEIIDAGQVSDFAALPRTLLDLFDHALTPADVEQANESWTHDPILYPVAVLGARMAANTLTDDQGKPLFRDPARGRTEYLSPMAPPARPDSPVSVRFHRIHRMPADSELPLMDWMSVYWEPASTPTALITHADPASCLLAVNTALQHGSMADREAVAHFGWQIHKGQGDFILMFDHVHVHVSEQDLVGLRDALARIVLGRDFIPTMAPWCNVMGSLCGSYDTFGPTLD